MWQMVKFRLFGVAFNAPEDLVQIPCWASASRAELPDVPRTGCVLAQLHALNCALLSYATGHILSA